MSKELNERVMACVGATEGLIDDYGQRSALGMARGWLETQKPIKMAVNSLDRYEKRDELAAKLVEIMEGEDYDECKAALASARAEVNAPFVDPAMLGWQAERAKRGQVGSVKKNER